MQRYQARKHYDYSLLSISVQEIARKARQIIYTFCSLPCLLTEIKARVGVQVFTRPA